jgi:hypothetical protein
MDGTKYLFTSEIKSNFVYENAGIPKLIILQSIQAVRLVTCCKKLQIVQIVP